MLTPRVEPGCSVSCAQREAQAVGDDADAPDPRSAAASTAGPDGRRASARSRTTVTVRVADAGLGPARPRAAVTRGAARSPRKWSRRPPWPPTTTRSSAPRSCAAVERELEVGGVLGRRMTLDLGAGRERPRAIAVDRRSRGHRRRGRRATPSASAWSSPESAAITRSAAGRSTQHARRAVRRRPRTRWPSTLVAVVMMMTVAARRQPELVPWFPPPALPGSGSRGRRRVTVALSARLTRAPRDEVVSPCSATRDRSRASRSRKCGHGHASRRHRRARASR